MNSPDLSVSVDDSAEIPARFRRIFRDAGRRADHALVQHVRCVETVRCRHRRSIRPRLRLRQRRGSRTVSEFLNRCTSASASDSRHSPDVRHAMTRARPGARRSPGATPRDRHRGATGAPWQAPGRHRPIRRVAKLRMAADSRASITGVMPSVAVKARGPGAQEETLGLRRNFGVRS